MLGILTGIQPSPLDAGPPHAHRSGMRSNSPEDTQALGQRLAMHLFPGSLLLLKGDLGAGKTCLTQGIAAGLGIEGPVQSPTFLLISEYPQAKIPLMHADLYRLEREEELWGLAIEERWDEGVWVVEWAERFPDFWPSDRLEIEIFDAGDHREIVLRATGPRHSELARV